jgi:hypothetical protein
MTGIERTIIEILAVLIMVGGFALYEQHKGATKCLQADAAAVAKQEAHNEVKAATDAQTINQEAKDYHATLAAPDPIDAPHVSVCHFTPSAVPSAPTPGPRAHESPDSRSTDPPHPDVGPPLVKVGIDSDAQVRGLQDYIARVCLAR